jgi:hypothetical protein
MEMLTTRGAPRTRCTVIRLRDVLGDLVGRQRARSLIEYMAKIDDAMRGARRLSAPVTPRQAALALLVAACDAGTASAAFSRALAIADARHYEPGAPPGQTVLDGIEAEIKGCCDDADFEPAEWHLGSSASKAVDGVGEFRLFMLAVADPDARRFMLPYERIDVLPASSISAVAELWT